MCWSDEARVSIPADEIPGERHDRHRPPGDPGARRATRPGSGWPCARCMGLQRRAYDLSDWIAKHPGGAFFIGRTKNRDITSIIRTYHQNPEVIEKTLERYALDREATPRGHSPEEQRTGPFLFKEDFNSWRDTPQVPVRQRGRSAPPGASARLQESGAGRAHQDDGQDLQRHCRDARPSRTSPFRDCGWAYPPGCRCRSSSLRWCCCASSLAGFGHYAIHRPQKGVTRFLDSSFDMNYVALALGGRGRAHPAAPSAHAE